MRVKNGGRGFNRQAGELDGTTDAAVAAQVLREETGVAYQCKRLLRALQVSWGGMKYPDLIC